MTADELIQYIAWAVYFLIFVLTLSKAIRSPTRTNVDIALFFTVATAIIVFSLVRFTGQFFSAVVTALLLSLAFLLVRLVDDFASMPRGVVWMAGALWVLLSAANFFPPFPKPAWFSLLEVAYLVAFFFYTSSVFAKESGRANGVTRRRLRAVAAGSLFLVIQFLISSLGIFFPQQSGIWRVITDLLGLTSSIAFFLGFAPPALLRRAWQEPELRSFLGRAANLPRLPDTSSILQEMERGAAESLGAPRSRIGLWDAEAGTLNWETEEGPLNIVPSPTTGSGRAFIEQRPIFVAGIDDEKSDYADMRRRFAAIALLAAPISAGDRRLGVLTAYGPRAPIFAEEDLDLIQLLADQAAVVLESRNLIDEAARVRAREEVARLKEDFLSAAAHDLKTPLTTLVAQTQLMERRVLRNPDAPLDLPSIQRLVKETQRLRTLVLELLDASRAEQGKLVGERTRVNLVEAAQETCARHSSDRHPCVVDVVGDPEIEGLYDYNRILQLLENLVENAIKYSPEGGEVRIKLWYDGVTNHISVIDRGIGIPSDDLATIFDRFHRGTNVDDRRFAGMGLGLFICHAIAQQHGGDISVSSAPGVGSTFDVRLPAGFDVITTGNLEGRLPERDAVHVPAPSQAPLAATPAPVMGQQEAR